MWYFHRHGCDFLFVNVCCCVTYWDSWRRKYMWKECENGKVESNFLNINAKIFIHCYTYIEFVVFNIIFILIVFPFFRLYLDLLGLDLKTVTVLYYLNINFYLCFSSFKIPKSIFIYLWNTKYLLKWWPLFNNYL